MNIAITGGNGYLGSALAREMLARGHDVISLQRAAAHENPNVQVRRFVLGEAVDVAALQGVDALIHCAYDFRALDWPSIERINVHGSMQLFRTARDAGLNRSILISSISAFEGCKSLYGQAKLELERQAAPLGVSIIRPGLIWGQGTGSVMGALAKLASLPLVTPMVGLGNWPQYLSNEGDLAELIARILSGQVAYDRPIVAASSQPLTLKQIVKSLRLQSGRSASILAPLPWRLLWAGLKTVETLGLRPRTRSDSVVSLVNSDPSPDFSPLRSVDVPFRPFNTTP